MKLRSVIFFSICLFFLFFSCSSPMEKLMQESYGKNFEPPENYAYVPSGKLYISPDEKLSIAGFFMSKYEISNRDYAEFLNDLLRQGKSEEHKKSNPKSKLWFHKLNMESYPTHPAYADYPAVTITKEGAEIYCTWLTEKLKNKYPNFIIKVRLPTEEEWMYAARGGHDYAPYPWGGWYLRNSKGQFLANFKRLGTGHIHFDRKNNKYEVMTPDNFLFPKSQKDPKSSSIPNNLPSPVKSFIPNDFGLFHMSGNVAEMLSANASSGGIRTKGGCYDSTGWDIRIDADDEFEGWTEPSQYIGFRPIISCISKK